RGRRRCGALRGLWRSRAARERLRRRARELRRSRLPRTRPALALGGGDRDAVTMKLWIPGPTHVRPEVLAEQTKPMIGHRSKAMTELIERLDPHLRLAFGLAEGSSATVAVGSHSATGMMEGSLLGVGPRQLAVVNGAFSKRWAKIGRILGKDVTTLELPLGRAVSEEELSRALAEKGPFDEVTLVVCETSTGALTPLGPVARALATSPRTMLLVDVVSAIAGSPIDVDANRIDFALAGVNKAI